MIGSYPDGAERWDSELKGVRGCLCVSAEHTLGFQCDFPTSWAARTTARRSRRWSDHREGKDCWMPKVRIISSIVTERRTGGIWTDTGSCNNYPALDSTLPRRPGKLTRLSVKPVGAGLQADASRDCADLYARASRQRGSSCPELRWASLGGEIKDREYRAIV